MTRIITYSLKAGGADSDDYYRTIADFADAWLDESRTACLDLVQGFRAYRRGRGETDRSDAEYVFELLTLGILLREHGAEASHASAWIERLLSALVGFQARHPRAEGTVKFLRGWLGWFARRTDGRPAAGSEWNRLLLWLEADGETVKHERLAAWRDFLESQGEAFSQQALRRCRHLADRFAESSLSVLGRFTENVENFLREETPRVRHRYDARLLTRARSEYHLGMLGTEILSRAFRERFRAAKKKMVILPPCMSAPAETCKAVDTPLGAKCQACTPTCRVHQITKLGEKLGFGVTMIPDDVKVFGAGAANGGVGLVGVSCALTNWGGGWDADSAGIPAQGVLLDHVGCTFHWDRHGIPTDVNWRKLREVLGK